jgi:predicted nucleic acid-binding protein
LARISRAVCDAGPLIHLAQVDGLPVLRVAREILVPVPVLRELRDHPVLPTRCLRVELKGAAKDLAKLIADRFDLGPGESAAMALAKQEQVRPVLTDDLEARDVARSYGLEPRGTLGLVARACHEGVVSRADAVSLIDRLHADSTLYLTADLVGWAKTALRSSRP